MALAGKHDDTSGFSKYKVRNWDSTTNSSSNTISIDTSSIQWASTSSRQQAAATRGSSQSQGQTCNESKRHDNDQKAVFHGMKSAYRMSRHSTGEYGSQNPQREHAARTAAHVGIAFLKAKDYDFDRERSLKDIEDRHMADDGVIDSLISWLKDDVMPDGGDVNRGPLTDSEFEEAIKRAWKKIDNGSHKGGARVAIAAAEAYLGEKIW